MTPAERAKKIEEAELALDEIHVEAVDRQDDWTLRRTRLLRVALDALALPVEEAAPAPMVPARDCVTCAHLDLDPSAEPCRSCFRVGGFPRWAPSPSSGTAPATLTVKCAGCGQIILLTIEGHAPGCRHIPSIPLASPV